MYLQITFSTISGSNWRSSALLVGILHHLLFILSAAAYKAQRHDIDIQHVSLFCFAFLRFFYIPI
jgi:hypothetical protein